MDIPTKIKMAEVYAKISETELSRKIGTSSHRWSWLRLRRHLVPSLSANSVSRTEPRFEEANDELFFHPGQL